MTNFMGKQELQINNEPVSGSYVNIDGETFYQILNYDKMESFFYDYS
jgi:hypothetical protein